MVCIFIQSFISLYLYSINYSFLCFTSHTPGAKALSCCKGPGKEPLLRCRVNTPSSSETTALRPVPGRLLRVAWHAPVAGTWAFDTLTI